MSRNSLIRTSALALMLIACGGVTLLAPPAPSPIPTHTAFPLLSATLPFDPAQDEPATVTPILFPTHTATITPTETPLPTFTAAPTLEPQWFMQGPGEVVVPILLYHHIGFSPRGETQYYVSPEAFDQQMNLLYQWGYKTISVELLAQAVKVGAELPPKPVILTFDDGSATTFSRALPVMQRYGFTGVSYIVHNYIGIPDYMGADEIRNLHALGWEIGSHSLSHVDLTARSERQKDESVESRRRLQSLLGLPVLSFAYPFGAYDSDSLRYVHEAGYIAAMGLGRETLQGMKNLFYLYRQPVSGSDDLRAFSLLLPWRAAEVELPALTIVP